MNKTLVTIAFFVLVLVGLIGAVLVLLIRPDQLGVYIPALLAVLAVASAAAVNFAGLAKQGTQITDTAATVKTIQKQTNGTTSALTDQLAAQGAQIEALVAHMLAPSGTPYAVTTPITIVTPDAGRHALVTV